MSKATTATNAERGANAAFILSPPAAAVFSDIPLFLGTATWKLVGYDG